MAAADPPVPLLGKNNLPMRLFTSSGYPVTDVDGYILTSVSGECLALVNPTRGIYRDAQGKDLMDALSHSPLDASFDPTLQPAEDGNEPEIRCGLMLYDFQGRPLTDSQGRPLRNRGGELLIVFGPRGEPVSDFEGKQVIDKMGCVVRASLRVANDGKALHVFDENGQPLTDPQGFALLDLSGIALLQVDANQKPLETISGRSVYDISGNSVQDSNFDATQGYPMENMVPISIRDDICLAFNVDGHPLTSLLGVPLYTSSGSQMVSKNGSRWVDSLGRPATLVKKWVYDKYSLNGFKNSTGDPILLFDRRGMPLTDVHGAPQNHANGRILLLFNEEMDPVSDWMGDQIFDSCGHPLGHARFRPCSKIARLPTTPSGIVQFFNKYGYPLTNRFGVPLLNPNQQPMMTFDNFGRPQKDIDGNPAFDLSGLPVSADLNLALCGPTGTPLRLYNNEGRPITTCRGLVLRSISGKPFITDDRGRLRSECKDGKIYDRNMKPSNSCVFNPAVVFPERLDKLVRQDGRPLQLYDQTGYPLTDPDGLILFDNKGKSLVKCSPSGPITTADGKKAFDISGHACLRNTITNHNTFVAYDKYGRPLMDQYGKILRNRKGHKLVKRKYGEPIDTTYGGGLYDSNHVVLDDPEAKPYFSIPRESNVIGGCQLFDCDDLPVTDHLGDMLYSSSGVGLLEIDESGRPKADFIGRPVFDERGLPVTKSSGCWKDRKCRPLRLFNYLGYPLTDYRGRPLRAFNGAELIQVDDLGRPMFDSDYRFVKDAKGRNMLNEKFKPILNDRQPPPILNTDGSPLRLFNQKGWPLTDDQGRPLVNARGKCLLLLKNLSKVTDSFSKTIYDVHGRPLGCTAQIPIVGVDSKPLALYNASGNPLTAIDGTPLCRNSLCLIRFDMFGRPAMSFDGGSLFDASGRRLFAQ